MACNSLTAESAHLVQNQGSEVDGGNGQLEEENVNDLNSSIGGPSIIL